MIQKEEFEPKRRKWNFRIYQQQGVLSFLLINFGLLLDAVGIYLFRIPNQFATGGATGMSIILNYLYPGISVGLFMLILNIVLLIVGIFFVGFSFGAKTVYASVALSGFVWILQKFAPILHPLTKDKLLELIFAMLISAFGTAIVFYQNASTGGTDILAKILNQRTKLHIGKMLLLIDLMVTIFAVAVFGIQKGMYAILGVIIKGVLIDLVIESMTRSKQVVIISMKSREIQAYIVNDLKRGATLYRAVGAATNEEKQVISTIINRSQSVKLREYIRQIDEHAFLTIHNVSEIMGKGFRNSDL